MFGKGLPKTGSQNFLEKVENAGNQGAIKGMPKDRVGVLNFFFPSLKVAIQILGRKFYKILKNHFYTPKVF